MKISIENSRGGGLCSKRFWFQREVSPNLREKKKWISRWSTPKKIGILNIEVQVYFSIKDHMIMHEMEISVNYMHECKVFEFILDVYECISILPPLLLWAKTRQTMISHLVKTSVTSYSSLLLLKVGLSRYDPKDWSY